MHVATGANVGNKRRVVRSEAKVEAVAGVAVVTPVAVVHIL
jgi:hypothetical protein